METQKKLATKKDYIHIIMWLVFLCCFTVFAVNSFTSAQYLTTGNGIDGSTMAKLFVDSPNTNSISVDFNGSVNDEKTISFQIVNYNENYANEVLLDYSIQVSNVYNNLPLEYKLTCTSINEGNNVISNNAFYNSEHEWTGGKLLASTNCTHNYTLTIKWKTGHYDADTYANEIDLIKIIIDSEQII